MPTIEAAGEGGRQVKLPHERAASSSSRSCVQVYTCSPTRTSFRQVTCQKAPLMQLRLAGFGGGGQICRQTVSPLHQVSKVIQLHNHESLCIVRDLSQRYCCAHTKNSSCQSMDTITLKGPLRHIQCHTKRSYTLTRRYQHDSASPMELCLPGGMAANHPR